MVNPLRVRDESGCADRTPPAVPGAPVTPGAPAIPETTTLDVRDFLDRVEARLASARRGGGFARSDAPFPDLYGTAAAAGIRAALGDPITGKQAARAAAAIRDFRRPDGAFDDLTHGPLHRTATATSTLRLLGEPEHPPVFLAAKFRPEAAEAFLEGLDWDAPWPASHEFAGLLAVAIATGVDEPDWLEAYLAWLAANADPATGLWRHGRIGRVDAFPGRFGNLAGAFHVHFLLDALGRAWPFAERVVDTGLELASTVPVLRPRADAGPEAWGFPQFDWAYSTGRAAARTGHRRADAGRALADLAARAESALADPRAAEGDLHVVQARVALVAELAHQGLAVESGGRQLSPLTDARPFI
ncbi:hypothetical protein ACDF64_09690 [Agromyces sp. MMS24-JH15]|uniref:hypothetical protein n=1 Tax=Agromyces sp. MMS24-JH15 TaxID=3243765 RepID=UPI00374A5316